MKATNLLLILIILFFLAGCVASKKFQHQEMIQNVLNSWLGRTENELLNYPKWKYPYEVLNNPETERKIYTFYDYTPWKIYKKPFRWKFYIDKQGIIIGGRCDLAKPSLSYEEMQIANALMAEYDKREAIKESLKQHYDRPSSRSDNFLYDALAIGLSAFDKSPWTQTPWGYRGMSHDLPYYYRGGSPPHQEVIPCIPVGPPCQGVVPCIPIEPNPR